ncbi:MAG: 16S rRNA (adenine(1518)-N(6)/adenine(1519)-N(6))-dimethyltransferase RsmA [Rickettsiaceae bacterium]|nr:16S rRNA (adenine(1518)-N(6)/adenine(1519)-N(6))-dimethyltransferase RsmA [Rickettsiaceae bacterium]
MKESIASLAQRHGILPLKKLGQNFIYDISLCKKIASKAFIAHSDVILEIGPGTAGLTRAILELNPQKLIAIEKDKRCINLLKEVQNFYPSLDFIEKDALSITLETLKNIYQIPQNKKIKIIANLPYNIATTLITNWLKERNHVETMILMVQKEVAERIVSKPNCKSYGRLSIFCQNLSTANILFDVSPKVFYPSPKVMSSIIEIKPDGGRDISAQELKWLEKITQYAFSMRRKMLKTSLEKIANIITISQKLLLLRAENIPPRDYLELSKQISKSLEHEDIVL